MKIIAFVLLFLSFCSLKSQEYSILNPVKIDYLAYKYKYLDKDYSIRISSDEFNKAVENYKFYPNKINNYQDSLAVIMMLEFNDWGKCNQATITIGFSWKRLGYYTWQTEKEAKLFAKSVGINHPWRMYELLINEKDNTIGIISFFEVLRTKMINIDNNLKFENLSRKKTLFLALRINPQRIADVKKDAEIKQKEKEAYLKKHGVLDPAKLGVGCEKENCCQKPVVQKKVTEKEKEIY